ncbi:hypothetical protein HKX48_003726 [Thoreauomyces humboldtii]|nr:hypothetical protein HKX48_003726 [Thoreauomyces humboldtii]
MATIARTVASLRGELPRRTTISKLLKAKTISFFGGVCLLINGMTGPGVPFTQATFQQSGWFFPTILFLAFALVSALSVLFIIEAMQAVPGNKHFQGTVEFATLINFYFGNMAHYVGQFLLYGALQSNAMQCIVLMAQTFDNILIDVFGKSCALVPHGPNAGWYCVAKISDTFPSPFEDTFILFSCGILLVVILSVPLGMVNLDDNIIAQVVAFWLSVAIGIEWIGASFYLGLEPARVPALGTKFSTVVGTIMLNLAFTTVVPSWINIKKRDVNTQGVVWSAVAIAVTFYMLVGLIPALGFTLDASGSILPALMRTGKLNKTTAYMFSIVMLLPSIPVNFIVAQNNLVQNKVAGKRVGIILAHVLPWFFCIPLQTGQTMQAFISWTSLLFVSTANFIIPLLIYIKCLRFRREYNESRALSEKQKLLLKEIHWSSRTIHRFIDDAIARDTNLAAWAKRHPGQLPRDRSDLSLRGAVPPLEDETEAVRTPEKQEDLSTPMIILPPTPPSVSTKSFPIMPLPSPNGSILKNPYGQLDLDQKGQLSPLDVPAGDLSGRLLKLKKPSTVRFGGSEADMETTSRSSSSLAPQHASGDSTRGTPERSSIRSGRSGRSANIGPISVSPIVTTNTGSMDEEAYLKDDVPDPDMEHKMAKKDSRSANWDPETGSSGGVKDTLRRAMMTMSRRGTSQSILSPTGGAMYTWPPRAHSAEEKDSSDGGRPMRLEPMNVDDSQDLDDSESHLPPFKEDASGRNHRRDTDGSMATDIDDQAELIRKPSAASSSSPPRRLDTTPPRRMLPADLMRKQTLPVHPDYISPTFRSIPTWFPVRGRFVAYALLVVTVGVTIANIVVTFVGT